MHLRSCGDCQACCVLPSIDELPKPANVPCPHLGSAGCSAYETRPISCRVFECLWLQGELTEAHRPDRLGFLLVWQTGVTTKRPFLWAWEVRPFARYGTEASALLGQLAQKHVVLVTSPSAQSKQMLGPSDPAR